MRRVQPLSDGLSLYATVGSKTACRGCRTRFVNLGRHVGTRCPFCAEFLNWR